MGDIAESDWEDEGNPHGFIKPNQLDTYRRSRAERREMAEKTGKQDKKPHKHHHESRTEKARRKNKPLAMVMPKKKASL